MLAHSSTSKNILYIILLLMHLPVKRATGQFGLKLCPVGKAMALPVYLWQFYQKWRMTWQLCQTLSYGLIAAYHKTGIKLFHLLLLIFWHRIATSQINFTSISLEPIFANFFDRILFYKMLKKIAHTVHLSMLNNNFYYKSRCTSYKW